ncbi:MAG: potassium-transporting ATPase subunit KdpA [Steroidobacteraceae bacterium]
MTNDLAANTAISFATTTTWQAYGGETTMSSPHPTQAPGRARERHETARRHPDNGGT